MPASRGRRKGGKVARISQLYARPELTISFEFFPPKTPEAETTLFHETVPALKGLGASFFSVTYGAGGGTRDTTLRWSTAFAASSASRPWRT